MNTKRVKAIKIIATLGITITGVALCMVGSSAISDAKNPLKRAMDRITGRYRGVINSTQGTETIKMTGGIEIVRTGDHYQIVGGFADRVSGLQTNFNKQLAYDHGRLVFEGQPANVEGLDAFIERKSDNFVIKAMEDGQCMTLKINRVPGSLKMDLGFGPSWNLVQNVGSIDVKEIRI